MPFRFAVPALAALSLLASCLLISPKKLFWFDEIASYLLASAPSVPSLLAAVADQTDTAPPLFHLIIWGWTRLFPPGELSLRLVSAFGMAIALLVLWRTLSRTYAFWPVALGLLNAFCLSTLLLLQNAEARFYGVFTALTAMALWAYDRLGREESWKLLTANALLHAALVLVHVYGFFYSGALLGAFIVRDLAAGKLKPRVYMTVLAGWLAFVPWIPSYRWQMQVGQPHSWMPVPTPEMLLAAYSFSLPLPLILIGLFFVGALFALARQRGAAGAPEPPEARSESSLWIAAFALLTVPVAAWVFSRLAFPIFQDRYMLPALASWAILFAALASRLLPARPFEGWKRLSLFATPARLALVGWLVGLLAAPVAYGALVRQQTPPHRLDEALGHVELPVALESPHLYLPRFYYAERRDRYHYILDWEAALSPRSITAAAPDYKILSGFKRHYPELNVTQGEAFLQAHDRFLLVDEDYRAWSELRLESNPMYKLTPLGPTAGGMVYLVEKRSPSPLVGIGGDLRAVK